ncbi:MAG TPA: acetate--CoA ligase family protein [Solirubrobacteraceae bacterium]|nr:acetate--CoA ligase family protein [Solirubrobacteraceae bacterium]
MTVPPAIPSMTARPVEVLFDPASVAVVGASEDPRKWGNWLAQGALRGESRRPAYLVNHRAATILGRRAYRTIEDLPETPELVVIAVPGPAIAPTVEAALDAGARALVVISAGPGGDARGEHDAALAQRVRAAGAVLLGPNCLGVLDSGQRLELVPNPLPAGAIGLISQSGNLALELGLMAAPEGLGFSRFASLGNQADLGATELIDAFATHDPTEVIAVYIEDFRDGRAFARAAARAVQAGTPVLALAIDGSGAGSRAVQSHTGALASDSAAIDAAFAAAGVQRVRTPRELVDAAQALLRSPASRGRRVAVLGDGGGHVSIAAAVAMQAGLEVPELSEATAAPLRETLPAAAGVSNPIDLAGAAERDVHVFDRVARDLLGGGEVDALLVTGYFGGYAEYGPETAEEELRTAELMGAAVAATGRPAVAQTMYPHGPAAQALRRSGVPVYESVEQAAGALALLADRGTWEPQPIPELPAAEPPTPATPATPAPATPAGGYLQARALLAAAGIRFVAHHEVRNADEAVAAALQVGYPVVLKALGHTHKSDAGGVVLNIGNEGRLRAAYAGIATALDPERCTLEQMAPLTDGIELLIGARWDPRFGPVALAGSGGLYAEILRDTAVRLAPVTEAEAEAMLRALRIAPLLTGARGRPPLDVGAAAAALAALSRVAAGHPELAELEINPLLVTRSEAIALDARFINASTPSQERESAVHLHP